MAAQSPTELEVLVITPVGRDAELTCIALREGGINCRVCVGMAEVSERARGGCGAILVAEEAFADGSMELLEESLRAQPAWSDIPVILLTLNAGSAIESSTTGRAIERLGNVLLLERPTRVGTLLSLVRTALRARQRQYEIRRHMERLEETERSLERRSQELSRSNTELQDFAYVASHDLKEPLRGISHYTHFLLEDEGERLSAEARRRVETVQRLANRMYSLLDSLLEYSKVGRTELTIQEHSLSRIASDVAETMRPWLEQMGARLLFDGELPTLPCDSVRVGQVFSNLIANAVKYNEQKERIVEIGCVRDQGAVAIYVRDNGIGIAEQFQETVFRMFRRLHHRDQYSGGTGAGLTLVKRIVERHGGRIWLESEPGRGSTFYFTLGPTPAGAFERGTAVEPQATGGGPHGLNTVRLATPYAKTPQTVGFAAS